MKLEKEIRDKECFQSWLKEKLREEKRENRLEREKLRSEQREELFTQQQHHIQNAYKMLKILT